MQEKKKTGDVKEFEERRLLRGAHFFQSYYKVNLVIYYDNDSNENVILNWNLSITKKNIY